MKRFLSFLLWVFIGISGTFLGNLFDNPHLMLQILNQFLILLIAMKVLSKICLRG